MVPRCFATLFVGRGHARNPQSSLHSLRGTPRAPAAKKTMLLYLKRASNARPYTSVSKYLVGATIGRPPQNDITFLWNGGSKPPPYTVASQPIPREPPKLAFARLGEPRSPHPSSARDPSVTARLSFSSEAKNLTSSSLEDDNGRLPPSPEGKARRRGASLS